MIEKPEYPYTLEVLPNRRDIFIGRSGAKESWS
jgi:hypothetical protein